MSAKEPTIETQIAAAGILRIIIQALFPIGYIYLYWKVLPWPMLVWAAFMIYGIIYRTVRAFLEKSHEPDIKINRYRTTDDDRSIDDEQ